MDKDSMIKQLQEEKNSLQKEYNEFVLEMARKNSNNITNNTLNMYYILNNFNDAHNLEEEIEYITEEDASVGCQRLITSRCVDNINVEKRPFHCTDVSRSKYLVRTKNEWCTDYKCSKVMDKVRPIIQELYKIDDSVDTTTKINNILMLMELETKGKKKIINYLNDTTSVKDLIKN